jgi:photosystem II stability/assembly factor-like uncharacterized protein
MKRILLALALFALTLIAFGCNAETSAPPQVLAPTPTHTLPPPTHTPRVAVSDATPTAKPKPTKRPRPTSGYIGFKVNDLAFVDALHGWAIGMDSSGKLAMRASEDGGVTWRALPVPMGQVSHLRFADLQDGWAFGAGLFETKDGGNTWLNEDVNGEIMALEPMDKTLLALEKRECSPREVKACYSLLVSKDSGRTFNDGLKLSHIPFGQPELVRGNSFRAWIFIPQPPKPGFGAITGRLLTTSDGGTTWQELPLPAYLYEGCTLAYGGNQLWLGCSAPASWAMSQNAVYVSSDGGSHWNQLENTPGAPAIGDLVVTSPTRAFATLGMAEPLVATTDGGLNWRIVIGDDAYPEFAWYAVSHLVFTDELHGWAILGANNANEILCTLDGGLTWQRILIQ